MGPLSLRDYQCPMMQNTSITHLSSVVSHYSSLVLVPPFTPKSVGNVRTSLPRMHARMHDGRPFHIPFQILNVMGHCEPAPVSVDGMLYAIPRIQVAHGLLCEEGGSVKRRNPVRCLLHYALQRPPASQSDAPTTIVSSQCRSCANRCPLHPQYSQSHAHHRWLHMLSLTRKPPIQSLLL